MLGPQIEPIISRSGARTQSRTLFDTLVEGGVYETSGSARFVGVPVPISFEVGKNHGQVAQRCQGCQVLRHMSITVVTRQDMTVESGLKHFDISNIACVQWIDC